MPLIFPSLSIMGIDSPIKSLQILIASKIFVSVFSLMKLLILSDFNFVFLFLILINSNNSTLFTNIPFLSNKYPSLTSLLDKKFIAYLTV